MKISTSKDITHNFKTVEVNNIQDLFSKIANGKNWSCGIFKDGHRSINNFQEAHTIALDIDDGMNIKDAKELFKEYKCAILPSKSHQIEKNGLVADRFRVVLFLEDKITNAQDFTATWHSLYDKFPQIDSQCPDASRLWYPATTLYHSQNGKLVKCQKYIPPEINDLDVALGFGAKGQLSNKTFDFITFGANLPNGSWNGRLNQASIDLREQGYSMDEALALLSKPTGHLDDNDKGCIDSVYNKDEMRYPPRNVKKNAFKFETIKEVYNNKDVLKWTVDGLLIESGLSIIVAQPKAGKSTLTRQLAKSVAQGGQFLGRKCVQGNVLYLALEEHALMLKKQFRQVGVKEDDPITLHVGTLNNFDSRYEDLIDVIGIIKPKLIVIDTMHLFTGIQELNNYTEVNIELSKLRDVARRNNTHILMVHHQNKPASGASGKGRGGLSVLGSSAIHGAVDCIMVLNRAGKERSMRTDIRGGRPFFNQPLKFDWDSQTYILGEVDNDDF